MGAISKEAVQKATLLALIGQFNEGVYTKLRLHKLAYLAEDGAPKRPFTYKHYDHGPFSIEVQGELEGLIDLGMVKPRKLEEAKRGHKYFVTNRNAYSTAIDIVENTLPGLLEKIMEVVEDYGYLDQKKLLQKAYEKMGDVDYDEIIVQENLPGKIETEMSEEDIWDFELASNSFLINELSKLSQTINSISVDEDIKAELFNA